MLYVSYVINTSLTNEEFKDLFCFIIDPGFLLTLDASGVLSIFNDKIIKINYIINAGYPT